MIQDGWEETTHKRKRKRGKKKFAVEFRPKEPSDWMKDLFDKEWNRWGSYTSEHAAQQAVEHFKHAQKWWEWRIVPM